MHEHPVKAVVVFVQLPQPAMALASDVPIVSHCLANHFLHGGSCLGYADETMNG